MIQLVFNGQVKRKFQKYLSCLLVIIIIFQNNNVVKASNNRDYLNITLADIIITWYNASGVAIGNTHLLNEIESLYGLITIEDLVDNDVIVTTDITATKEDIKDAIGYGSASVPYLRVNHNKLRQYLGGLPLDEVARNALTAMFSWENNATEESIFEALGIVVGNVVNLGKIGYNVIKDTLVENIHSLPLVQTLKDVYNNFTNSTYFQDIINKGQELDVVFDYTPYTTITSVQEIPEGYQIYFAFHDVNNIIGILVPPHVFLVIAKSGSRTFWYMYNNNPLPMTVYRCSMTRRSSTEMQISSIGFQNGESIPERQRYLFGNYNTMSWTHYGPYVSETTAHDNEWYEENDPWNSQSGSSGEAGVTEYINKAVGNITKQNYLDLTANIGNGEYMFIFNKYEYDVIINQITNNTTNGDYIDNGPIITNYNTTYIQNPTTVEVRPTYIPAPTGQPIQPFISPRPTPIPEETEEAIYNGGIAESIKDKFPFCIPWDIQALITGLWSNNRQAPYIHWDARFGSWGKLGEVTIDLQPYDTAAQIFRSTTLLLWIIGLVVLTRNMIGS